MKIIKNEKLITRNGKIGQYTSLAALIVLGGGMYISFSRPELFTYSVVCLVSGKIFMVPTYAFIVGIFILIGCGLFQQATGHVLPALENIPAKESLGLFLIARAFAAGCTALTGVEATVTP